MQLISDNFISKNTDFSVIDDFITVLDQESFSAGHRILEQEKICIGTSSGCATAGVEKYIQESHISQDANILVMFPDCGLMYSHLLFGSDSTIFGKYGPTTSNLAKSTSIQEVNNFLNKLKVPFKML